MLGFFMDTCNVGMHVIIEACGAYKHFKEKITFYFKELTILFLHR